MSSQSVFVKSCHGSLLDRGHRCRLTLGRGPTPRTWPCLLLPGTHASFWHLSPQASQMPRTQEATWKNRDTLSLLKGSLLTQLRNTPSCRAHADPPSPHFPKILQHLLPNLTFCHLSYLSLSAALAPSCLPSLFPATGANTSLEPGMFLGLNERLQGGSALQPPTPPRAAARKK